MSCIPRLGLSRVNSSCQVFISELLNTTLSRTISVWCVVAEKGIRYNRGSRFRKRSIRERKANIMPEPL